MSLAGCPNPAWAPDNPKVGLRDLALPKIPWAGISLGTWIMPVVRAQPKLTGRRHRAFFPKSRSGEKTSAENPIFPGFLCPRPPNKFLAPRSSGTRGHLEIPGPGRRKTFGKRAFLKRCVPKVSVGRAQSNPYDFPKMAFWQNTRFPRVLQDAHFWGS